MEATLLFRRACSSPTFTQAVATIPQAIHLSWFAIFMGQVVQTSLSQCAGSNYIALKTFRRILIGILPCVDVQHSIVTVTLTSVVTVS